MAKYNEQNSKLGMDATVVPSPNFNLVSTGKEKDKKEEIDSALLGADATPAILDNQHQ